MKEMDTSMNISEILTHYAEENSPYNAMAFPIFETSIFYFNSFDDFSKALSSEEDHFLYSRGNNPTVRVVEKKIAALEKTEDARLCSSGMAAISSAILAFLKSGDHVVCVQESYSWTFRMFHEYLKRFGVNATFVSCDADEIINNVRPNTKMIYLESPTTMFFNVLDLRKIATFAKNNGIVTLIDNTWATPIFQNPAEMGIDIILHSASKYFSGHSDVVAGVVAGKKELINHIFNQEILNLGGVIAPFEAWLILRGLRTLEIRLKRHYESALKVCDFLLNHPKVESVNYPMHPKSPQYELAKSQMRGGSGLLSFRLKTKDIEIVRKFTNSLKIFRKAVSWGGYESLVVPCAVTRNCPEENINLIRIHVGLETVKTLIDDLERALRVV